MCSIESWLPVGGPLSVLSNLFIFSSDFLTTRIREISRSLASSLSLLCVKSFVKRDELALLFYSFYESQNKLLQ